VNWQSADSAYFFSFFKDEEEGEKKNFGWLFFFGIRKESWPR
jgi:hypothetical protein